MLTKVMSFIDSKSFQSAPGREAGRCPGAPVPSSTTTKFQSAPGREAGRCTRSRHASCGFRGFNPRPAVRPGDAGSIYSKYLTPEVSIRARP